MIFIATFNIKIYLFDYLSISQVLKALSNKVGPPLLIPRVIASLKCLSLSLISSKGCKDTIYFAGPVMIALDPINL